MGEAACKAEVDDPHHDLDTRTKFIAMIAHLPFLYSMRCIKCIAIFQPLQRSPIPFPFNSDHHSLFGIPPKLWRSPELPISTKDAAHQIDILLF